MGKRSGKKHNNYKKGGGKKIKKQWTSTQIPEDNQIFRKYYEMQLGLSEEQFKQFWSAMKQKLPVVFRVNPNFPNYQSFCNKLNDENYIKSILNEEGQGSQQMKQEKLQETAKEVPKVELLKWYPGDICYSINTDKQQFKKSKSLSSLHKYLQKSFDSGLISRQQLVSMLPPLYLNVQPDEMVLDMCAAPGSKTSQILEMLHGQSKQLSKGCVIANDADYSRAQMLIHQLNRAGTASMAVVNHAGQFFPELYSQKINSIKTKYQFDKILCDVPCSGDGATRKIPIKWVNWHTSDGMVLHPLQLAIVMKSINLLKRGGSLVYSTCSLSPMQDEAVLHALMQKVSKGLQIVDIHKMYQIKGRRGLLNWKVLGVSYKQQKDQKGQHIRQLVQYKTIEDAKNNYKVKDTLFPPQSQEQAKKMGLHNSMRILPHDQNSGGFFIALLKKHDDFQWKYQVKETKGDEKQVNQQDLEQRFVNQNLPETDKNIVGDNQNPKQIDNQNQNKQQMQQENGNEQQGDNEGQQGQGQEMQEKPQKQQKQKTQGKSKKEKKPKGTKYQTFDNIQQEEYQIIKKFYGISDQIKNLLYVRDNVNSKKNVLLISEGIRNYLLTDSAKRVNLVNMGCRVFEKGKQSFAGHECLYRVCQEGIHFILPFIQKRKVQVPLAFFKRVLSIHSLTHDEIEDIQVRQKIRVMTQGSFCIYIDQVINNHRVVDAMVGQNFKNSFHLLVSKQDVASLNIRYL